MWIIFQAFIESVVMLLLLFMFWYFGQEAYGILASRLGLNPHSLYWKMKSLPLDHQGSPFPSLLIPFQILSVFKKQFQPPFLKIEV